MVNIGKPFIKMYASIHSNGRNNNSLNCCLGESDVKFYCTVSSTTQSGSPLRRSSSGIFGIYFIYLFLRYLVKVYSVSWCSMDHRDSVLET